MTVVLVLTLLTVAGVLVVGVLLRRQVAMRAWDQELEAAFARDEDGPSLERVMLTPRHVPRHRLAVPEVAEAAETV